MKTCYVILQSEVVLDTKLTSVYRVVDTLELAEKVIAQYYQPKTSSRTKLICEYYSGLAGNEPTRVYWSGRQWRQQEEEHFTVVKKVIEEELP